MKEIKEEADRLVELHANECPKGYGWCANRFGLKHSIIDVSNTIEIIEKIEDNYYCGEHILDWHKQVKQELESRLNK